MGRDTNRDSMLIRKRVGDKEDPCGTPFSRGKGREVYVQDFKCPIG